MSAAAELSGLFLFRDIPPKAVSNLCILAPPTRFGVGSTVFKQGADADVALLLIKGKLEVEVQSDGVGRRVGQVHPGEIVGEQALFSRDGTRSATVLAAEDSQALIINWDLLERASDNPAIVAIERHLMGTLARRVRSTNTAIQKVWKEMEDIEAPIEKRRFAERLRSLFRGGRT